MTERNILLVSIGVTTLFALLGVVWGVAIDSSMIIFDGLYSLISVGLSFLSLVVLKQIQDKGATEDSRYPFGKAHFEPLLIVFKSLSLIGMCSFSAINSFSVLLAGGRSVAPGPAVIYALISTLGCLAVMLFIQRNNKLIESNLLTVEKNEWLGDFLLSLGVLIGFSATYMLQDGRYNWIVPYADPGMVVMASGIFIFLPLKSFIGAAREMIFYQVNDQSMKPVENEAADIANEYNAKYKLRMVSIGRELNIEVNFLLEENRLLSVEEMDAIRSRIAIVVSKMKKQHWINITFTQQPLWL
ncbi:cation diffusion facilitator family transporter [Alkalimarinus coralli]|uniref:cation diffusion facilitator family transporter n=1 Tax=Alkalimarinus coralli TaxID=2935863 RepID=UPI00202B73A8|nr:cation transporter [Alkalimarinus coralli]